MIIFDFIKRTFKANTNVKGWMGWTAVRENGRVIKNIVSDLNTANKGDATTAPKDFDDWMKRNGLNELDLKKNMKMRLYNAILALCLGLIAFVAMFYFFFFVNVDILTALMTFSLALVMFVYAIREHFNYFLLKQRRFDLTVKDWYKQLLSFKGDSK